MIGKLNTLFAAIAVLQGLGLNVESVDVESAKETKCFDIKEAVSLEGKKFGDLSSLLLLSRLDLYYAASEVSTVEIRELQEDELYYDACIHAELKENSTLSEVTGFNKEKVSRAKIIYVPASGEKDSLTDPYVPEHYITKGDPGKSATSYATFTDNSTFVFWATCWDDGQMTWSVSGPAKGLPEDKVKLVHEHAISLGFKKQYFTGLRYDYC